MALLKLSGLLTAISGKIGGSILATGANGSYIKQNSFGQQPNTPKQSAVRNKVYQWSQAWRSLTPTEKATWSAETVNYPYVNAVGDTVNYTGYQLFIKLNSNRILTGQALLVNAPTFVAFSTAEFNISTLTTLGFNIGWINNTGTNRIILQASKSMVNGIKPTLQQYKQVYEAPMLGASANVNIISLYNQVFASPTLGSYIYIRVRAVVTATGYSQPWQENIFKIVS